jgi:hypothetical protein
MTKPQHLNLVACYLAALHKPTAVERMVSDLAEAAQQGQLERVQELLAAGADVNAADAAGSTPLYLAAEQGHHELVQLLLEANANVQAACGGWTLLHAPAEQGHTKVVQLLLAAGVDVDAADSAGTTALFCASLYARLEVVQLLLHKGANPRLPTGSRNILPTAALCGDKRVVQLLLEAWGKPQITADGLITAAALAADYSREPSMASHAVLAKELRKLSPARLQQLLVVESNVPAAAAVTAVLDAWAADVSSLDEQRAAVRRRVEAVASDQQAVQQLIVAVAGMAKGRAVEQPQESDSAHMTLLSEAVQLQQLQL